jgi:hypothetical protein
MFDVEQLRSFEVNPFFFQSKRMKIDGAFNLPEVLPTMKKDKNDCNWFHDKRNMLCNFK